MEENVVLILLDVDESEEVQGVNDALILILVEVRTAPLEVIQGHLDGSRIVGPVPELGEGVGDKSDFREIEVFILIEFIELLLAELSRIYQVVCDIALEPEIVEPEVDIKVSGTICVLDGIEVDGEPSDMLRGS